MSIYKKLSKVQNDLADELLGEFNARAKKTLVNMVGISHDEKGPCILVGLSEKPTKEQEEQLPVQKDGVRVKYEVIGKITPR